MLLENVKHCLKKKDWYIICTQNLIINVCFLKNKVEQLSE